MRCRTMDGREAYGVPSAAGHYYLTTQTNCTCPDAQRHEGMACKHQLTVRLHVTTAHGLVAGWADRGPLNQYARSSYRSGQSWATWRDADCSAAALYWLLGAYGEPLGSLDDAIAPIGGPVGHLDETRPVRCARACAGTRVGCSRTESA